MRARSGVAKRRRHKKILQATKGYRLSYSKLFRRAHEAYMHAGQYSRIDRRKRIGQFRRLWITRLSAALQEHNLNYSRFIHQLTTKNIQLNRKVLAELAVTQPELFSKVVQIATT